MSKAQDPNAAAGALPGTETYAQTGSNPKPKRVVRARGPKTIWVEHGPTSAMRTLHIETQSYVVSVPMSASVATQVAERLASNPITVITEE